MLGFSKKGRAEKVLLSAFDVLLIGRREDKTEILQSAKAKLPQLSEKVLNGANAYEVAGKVIQDHILGALQKTSKEDRVDYLKRISESNFKHQPHIFEMISHVNYCLMILEDEAKPLIPPGSAKGFISQISTWFATKDRQVQRVMMYFEDSTQNHRYHLQQTRKRNQRASR